MLTNIPELHVRWIRFNGIYDGYYGYGERNYESFLPFCEIIRIDGLWCPIILGKTNEPEGVHGKLADAKAWCVRQLEFAVIKARMDISLLTSQEQSGTTLPS